MLKNKTIHLHPLVFITAFTAFFVLIEHSFAARKISEVDYFVSLRSNNTNVRSGPGQNYPIKFSFKLRGLPLRVIREYDNWNEVEDYEGQAGWISKALLTKKRTLMIRTSKSFVNMHSKNNEKSRIIFRLENKVLGKYLKCLEKWCGIEVNGKKGWVAKASLFGDE